MSEGERLGFIVLCLGAALAAVTFVNMYAGSREDDGFTRGYIAGYAEARAGLPSRHEYKVKTTSPERVQP
jgi:hypothetical protein